MCQRIKKRVTFLLLQCYFSKVTLRISLFLSAIALSTTSVRQMERPAESGKGIESRHCRNDIESVVGFAQKTLGMCQTEIIHIFVKRLRARLIEVLAQVGAVGPYALCEVGEAQFRVEIDALLGEEHPQAFAETVDVLRGGRSGFRFFCRHFRNDRFMPADGIEHILLTVYEEADHQPAGERTEHVGILHQRHRVLATEHLHEEQQEEHDGDATEPVQIYILVVGVLFLETAVIGGNLDERPDCAEQS